MKWMKKYKQHVVLAVVMCAIGVLVGIMQRFEKSGPPYHDTAPEKSFSSISDSQVHTGDDGDVNAGTDFSGSDGSTKTETLMETGDADKTDSSAQADFPDPAGTEQTGPAGVHKQGDGWVMTPQGRWSFYYPDGTYAVGWVQHKDGNWYYFIPEGWLVTDAITPDNRYVGPDGAWVQTSSIDPVWMSQKSQGTSVVIFDRSDHMLEVWSNGQKIYTCLGTSSKNDGDKVQQGDSRTPLGEFYICQKNTQSQYYKSLGLSYPDIPHAQAGLENGIIGQEDYNRIVSAIEQGITPPWDTALGGEIMIHGERNMQDWSQGCITISNEDIDAIWPLVEVGTAVIVQE